jgi:type IV secretory pathway TraG/TraD family ATPase VirD4
MKKLFVWVAIIALLIISYRVYAGVGSPRVAPAEAFSWLEDHRILAGMLASFVQPGAYLIWYLGLDPNTPARVSVEFFLSWWAWLSCARFSWCTTAKIFGLNSPRVFGLWRIAWIPWRLFYRPFRWVADWIRHFQHGRKATSRWASWLEMMYLLYRPGQSYLGLIEFAGIPGCQPVGLKTQGHEMIFGMTGGGKSSIVETKVDLHDGSTIVVDPAGGLTKLSYRRHGSGGEGVRGKGHKSFRLDPFNQAREVGGRSACWNVFDEVDRFVERFGEEAVVRFCASIAEGLIIKEPGESKPFFPNSAKGLLSGLAVFVYATEPKGSPRRNLMRVRELALSGDTENVPEGSTPTEWLLFQMSQHKADYGGVIAMTAQWMMKGGRESTRDIISTIMSQTIWLSFPEMQAISKSSDFSFQDFKYHKTPHHLTICAPIGDMQDKLAPWLRLLVVSVIDAYEKTPIRSNKETLLVVDELASIGFVSAISKGPAYLRRHSLKFIGISQDVRGVADIYSNLDGMMGNADVIYWLQTDADSNYEALMIKLDEMTRREKIEGGWFSKSPTRMQDVDRPLMYRNQIAEYLSRGHVIVTRAKGRPLKLSIPLYFRELPVWCYAPDPDYQEFPPRALTRRVLSGWIGRSISPGSENSEASSI